jgi:hypothetical protein
MIRYFITLAIFMGLWAVNGLARDPVSIDLNSFKWKNRLLFFFASSEEDRFYLALKEEITRQGMEIRDRDLLVFEVFEKGESRLGKEHLSSGQVLALRKHLSVRSGQFMIILIGKDGGEKLRQDRLVELKEIFGIIDAMPMRQQEMRKK